MCMPTTKSMPHLTTQQSALNTGLLSSGAAAVVSGFVLQNLSGPGLDAAITLPPLASLQAHDTLELDFKLSCPGSRDADCPIWDHTVQLFVCCDDPTSESPPCGPCGPTVWSEPYSPSAEPYSSSSAALNSPSSASSFRTAATDRQPPQERKTKLPAAFPSAAYSSPSSLSSSSAQCGRELGRWITPFRWTPCPNHACLVLTPHTFNSHNTA